MPSRAPLGSDADVPSRNLTARVLARVGEAGLTIDRRGRATRRRPAEPARPDPLAAGATRTAEQIREARSMRRVFRDLGVAYRRYRRQTGAPISADVRNAARRFRRELSLPSLVLVAASLDELDILTW